MQNSETKIKENVKKNYSKVVEDSSGCCSSSCCGSSDEEDKKAKELARKWITAGKNWIQLLQKPIMAWAVVIQVRSLI
jgi:hypothetical protein